MAELLDELRTAFERHGYDVGDVGDNRGQLRVTLLEDRADEAELRSLVEDVVAEERLLGVNVTTESTDARGVQTVVSVRQRR